MNNITFPCNLQIIWILFNRKINFYSNSKSSQGHVRVPRRHDQDDQRQRRRRLYNLQSEEKPQMPHMTKSFYSFVMDNKDVVKIVNLLATCTKSVKPELTTFIKRWRAYHFLWKNDKSSRELMELELLEFESTLG